MDPLTHMALGGALAHAVMSRRCRFALLAGAAGALLPDADVFLAGQGSSVAGYVLHRHFTHALVLIPVMALIAAAPFALFRSTRAHWPGIYLASLLGAATHGLLDAATAYGTHLLWPFSNARVSWDVVSVIDPAFTAILLIGLLLALRRKTIRPAWLALAGCALYMGFAAMQHERALSAQRQLAESRGQTVERSRAIPLLGHMFAWRSVYQHDGVLYADAIRLLPFTAPRIRSGETVPLLRIDDATLAHASPQAAQDLRLFAHFADGFIARIPGRPDLIGDMRYATPANSFRPLWGVRYDPADAGAEPTLIHLAREDVRGRLRLLWRDIRGETRAIGQVKQAD